MEWVWVKDDELAYIPCRILARDARGISVETYSDRQQFKVAAEQLGPAIPWARALSTSVHVDDLVQMDEVNEASILHSLRSRYFENIIYTNVGDILVSINPFKWLPLYSEEIVKEYAVADIRDQLPPHVFSIASNAYRAICESTVRAAQTILISGESGSGKTECTKQCVQYLSSVAGGGSSSKTDDGLKMHVVAQRMLATNPLLEAFGNAKTVRNDNSSRFGKFMQVLIDRNNEICGCETRKYLLEKSRVVQVAPGERSYHFFYQLCHSKYGPQLQLLDPEFYVNLGHYTVINGLDDGDEFTKNEDAMKSIGLSETERSQIYAVVAAVLHLVNIRFVGSSDGDSRKQSVNGPCRVEPESVTTLEAAGQLLQIPPEMLNDKLRTHTLTTPSEVVTLEHTAASAAAALLALCKGLYAEIFDWLVDRINQAVSADQNGGNGSQSSAQQTWIGILDIFGFEIFVQNSFEQLCINYANERLQQQFNRHTFQLEEALYRREQVPYEGVSVEYIDNQVVG